MPNPKRRRLRKDEREELRKQVIARDGPGCKLCPNKNKLKLELHHQDGNCNNWEPLNVVQLCGECHKIVTEPRGKGRRGVRASRALEGARDGNHNLGGKKSVCVSVSVNDDVEVRERIGKRASAGSKEMEVKTSGVPLWLKFMFGEINKRGSISVRTATHSGAIRAGGVSSQSVKRWLEEYSDVDVLCPFMLTVQDGIAVVVLKREETYADWIERNKREGVSRCI